MLPGLDTTRPTGLRAARVYDGVRMHRNAPVLVVESGRIAGIAVNPDDVASDVSILDLGDVTVLPGLIDSHVHLAFDPTRKAKQEIADETAETLLTRMRTHLNAHLRAGVTTVRDLGDRDFLTATLRAQCERDGTLAPELLISGPPITPPGGHCWFLGGEAHGSEQLRAAVAARAERGVDVIKVMATGGVITPGFGPTDSQYGRDDLARLVEIAGSYGLPVSAHAHGVAGIADAVAAAAHSIEHASFYDQTGVAVDWATVDRMVAAGTFVGATEASLTTGELFDPGNASRLEQRAAAMVQLHQRGVRLVCCSDAGVSARKPHGVLPHGAVMLAELGLSAADALATVTTQAAAACGLSHRKGRLAADYDADLLAVEGDVLADLSALLRVRDVFVKGVRVAR